MAHRCSRKSATAAVNLAATSTRQVVCALRSIVIISQVSDAGSTLNFAACYEIPSRNATSSLHAHTATCLTRRRTTYQPRHMPRVSVACLLEYDSLPASASECSCRGGNIHAQRPSALLCPLLATQAKLANLQGTATLVSGTFHNLPPLYEL